MPWTIQRGWEPMQLASSSGHAYCISPHPPISCHDKGPANNLGEAFTPNSMDWLGTKATTRSVTCANVQVMLGHLSPSLAFGVGKQQPTDLRYPLAWLQPLPQVGPHGQVWRLCTVWWWGPWQESVKQGLWARTRCKQCCFLSPFDSEGHPNQATHRRKAARGR